MNPLEDSEFLDDEDDTDKEEGELVGEEESGNEVSGLGQPQPASGITEFNSGGDYISVVDPEITFKRPRTVVENNFDFKVLQNNVALESYIKGMVAKELEIERKKIREELTKQLTPKPNKPIVNMERESILKTPNKKSGMTSNVAYQEIIKSPSDTTIYAPALSKISNNPNKTKQIVEKILNDNAGNCKSMNGVNEDISDQITHFIEGVRLEAKSKGTTADAGQPQPGTSKEPTEVRLDPARIQYSEQVDLAKQKANQMIIDAEKYKATVNVPPGNYFEQVNNVVRNVQELDDGNILFDQNRVLPQQNLNSSPMTTMVLSDDDFFHVTCHVDLTLRSKIERGEFVELERLLPKQRNSFAGGDENRMNLMHKDGQVYFMPASSGNRISSVRKWEQAFRIYAAIYSQANPSRSSEIWQYVHTINVAASSYIWENVSNYDITFRHLMAQNPGRSWSKIYNQMWNMSMHDVIPKNFSFQGNNGQAKKQGQGGVVRKPKYCWGHNKGNCKDGAAKCKFVHRCSYCDNADHIKNNCPKPGNK